MSLLLTAEETRLVKKALLAGSINESDVPSESFKSSAKQLSESIQDKDLTQQDVDVITYALLLFVISEADNNKHQAHEADVLYFRLRDYGTKGNLSI